jgi:hypothetical protein
VFGRRQRMLADPLIDLSLFRSPALDPVNHSTGCESERVALAVSEPTHSSHTRPCSDGSLRSRPARVRGFRLPAEPETEAYIQFRFAQSVSIPAVYTDNRPPRASRPR